MEKTDFLYGIALLSVIPVRCEPREQSEMVTQLLFGDTFTIEEKKTKWWYIKNDYDNYEGWISENIAQPIAPFVYKEITQQKSVVVSSLHATVRQGNTVIPILIGSTLPSYDSGSKTFKIDEHIFSFEGSVTAAKSSKTVVNFAQMYLNSPYLWGGKTPYGIDCSGLVQQVGKLIGIKLPRDASQQIAIGEDISFLENTQGEELSM